MFSIIDINNFHSKKKKTAQFYQRRKYRFSQLLKYRKIICALFKPPMCEIQGQTHWYSQDYISRIKILISNPQVPNKKTCPKDLNYRYAGFQILDRNFNFQSPLFWTNENIQRFFFTRKDLFAIKKKPFIKFIVYDKLSIKKRTETVPES